MSSVEESLETALQVNHMTSSMTHQCHSAQWISVSHQNSQMSLCITANGI